MAPGHNSGADQRLLSFIQRVERLTEERKAIQADIREVFAEAKSSGYDVPALRQMIKERAMDAADLAEREALLETYRAALAGIVDTPLGEAAMRAAQ